MQFKTRWNSNSAERIHRQALPRNALNRKENNLQPEEDLEETTLAGRHARAHPHTHTPTHRRAVRGEPALRCATAEGPAARWREAPRTRPHTLSPGPEAAPTARRTPGLFRLRFASQINR